MKQFILLALLLGSFTVNADTYLNIYGASKHFGTTEVFNERNYGLGITKDLTKTTSVTVGAFKNSLNKLSVTVLYTKHKAINRYVDIGISGGLVTGYPVPIAPVAYPFIKVIGVQLGMLPKITGVTPATLFMSYQFKL